MSEAWHQRIEQVDVKTDGIENNLDYEGRKLAKEYIQKLEEKLKNGKINQDQFDEYIENVSDLLKSQEAEISNLENQFSEAKENIINQARIPIKKELRRFQIRLEGLKDSKDILQTSIIENTDIIGRGGDAIITGYRTIRNFFAKGADNLSSTNIQTGRETYENAMEKVNEQAQGILNQIEVFLEEKGEELSQEEFEQISAIINDLELLSDADLKLPGAVSIIKNTDYIQYGKLGYKGTVGVAKGAIEGGWMAIEFVGEIMGVLAAATINPTARKKFIEDFKNITSYITVENAQIVWENKGLIVDLINQEIEKIGQLPSEEQAEAIGKLTGHISIIFVGTAAIVKSGKLVAEGSKGKGIIATTLGQTAGRTTQVTGEMVGFGHYGAMGIGKKAASSADVLSLNKATSIEDLASRISNNNISIEIFLGKTITHEGRNFRVLDNNFSNYVYTTGQVYKQQKFATVYQVPQGKEISLITKMANGLSETKNRAISGDYIILQPNGEMQVIRQKNFTQYSSVDKSNTTAVTSMEKVDSKMSVEQKSVYEDVLRQLDNVEGKIVQSNGELRNVIRVEKDIAIMAPWGEMQYITSGGYVVRRPNGEMYGIQRAEFDNTHTFYQNDRITISENRSGIPREQVLENSVLSDSERLIKAEELLGIKLTQVQKDTIIHVHNEISKGVYKNTPNDLRQMAKALEEAGLNNSQRRVLMENGITGSFENINLYKLETKIVHNYLFDYGTERKIIIGGYETVLRRDNNGNIFFNNQKIEPGVHSFGRGSSNNIIINNSTVSSNHGSIGVTKEGNIGIMDNSSTNGTFIGKEIKINIELNKKMLLDKINRGESMLGKLPTFKWTHRTTFDSLEKILSTKNIGSNSSRGVNFWGGLGAGYGDITLIAKKSVNNIPPAKELPGVPVKGTDNVVYFFDNQKGNGLDINNYTKQNGDFTKNRIKRGENPNFNDPYLMVGHQGTNQNFSHEVGIEHIEAIMLPSHAKYYPNYENVRKNIQRLGIKIIEAETSNSILNYSGGSILNVVSGGKNNTGYYGKLIIHELKEKYPHLSLKNAAIEHLKTTGSIPRSINKTFNEYLNDYNKIAVKTGLSRGEYIGGKFAGGQFENYVSNTHHFNEQKAYFKYLVESSL